MINLTKNEFSLIGDITKDGKARIVTINKHLKESLFKMHFFKTTERLLFIWPL
jgi:hypothetical protein